LSARPLRVASFLAPRLRPLYEHVATALGDALGRPSELVDGDDFGRLTGGEMDAAFICGLPYVRLRDSGAAIEPLVAPAMGTEEPVYFSAVTVRAGTRARRLEDMAGHRLAVNEGDSHSGYGVVLAALAERGVPEGGFSELVQTGSHAGSLEALRAGAADVAAIDSHVLAVLSADYPAIGAELEVIERLGPSPSQPLVAGPGLNLGERAAAREALRELGAFELAPGVSMDTWVPVGDSDYDPIRRMRAAAESRSGF
jgi:phosphonate transport system substrate-binding protein